MARRAYGTGTLRVVGRSWIGSWYGPDGRRVQRKVGDVRSEGGADGLTKAQAERVLRRMREIDSPRAAADAERVTMEQAGDEFCQRLELKGRRKSHRLTVASDLRNHIAPFFAGKTARSRSGRRTSSATSRRSARRSRSRRSATTSTRCTRSSTSAFARAGARSNPVKLADRPTVKKTETRIQFLEQDELEQLLAATYPDDAFGRIEPTLYLTAAMTGLRQGELLGLRWRDVDFEARKVRVVSPYVRGEFGDPKSAGSGRSVPMAERVALALRELRGRSMYARDRDLVFCHPETGKPLDRSKLVRRFKQAIDRAERPPDHVPRAAPHVRDADGGRRHADAHAPALDGPRGLEDDADLRALPAERPGGRRRRSRIRVTLGSARPVRALVPRGTARSSPGMSR